MKKVIASVPQYASVLNEIVYNREDSRKLSASERAEAIFYFNNRTIEEITSVPNGHYSERLNYPWNTDVLDNIYRSYSDVLKNKLRYDLVAGGMEQVLNEISLSRNFRIDISGYLLVLEYS